MNSRFGWLYDCFFPRDCTCMICCQEDRIGEDGLCDACRLKLKRAVSPANKLPLSGISAGLLFDGDIRKCVYRFKKRGQTEYASFFAQYMTVPEEWNVGILIPVPMHAWDEFVRGRNHASTLARMLGEQSGIPVNESIMIKQRHTKPQKSMKAKERSRNVRGAFALTQRVDGQVIALVDDVFTTGATVQECARILKQNGAARVYAVCACTVM